MDPDKKINRDRSINKTLDILAWFMGIFSTMTVLSALIILCFFAFEEFGPIVGVVFIFGAGWVTSYILYFLIQRSM